MIRLVVFGLILAALAAGQDFSMASSADGAVLYFASKLALRGEAVVVNPVRIFQHADPPILQVLDVQSRTIAAPFVSDDGLTTGAFTYSICVCAFQIASPNAVLNLKRAGQYYVLYGNSFRVSRNGRFVFDTGFGNFPPGPNIQDLDTGLMYRLPNVVPRHSRQSISNDGALLSSEAGAIAGFGSSERLHQVLLTPRGKNPEILAEGVPVHSAAITAQGNSVFVLFEIKPEKLVVMSLFRLIRIDLATRERSILFEGYAELSSFTVNAEGSRLLLQSKNDVLLWDRLSGWRSLFSHEEGITESLLIDNGESVFVKTRTNRMYRIEVKTGEAQQLYAPFPSSLRQQSFGAYPGSLIRFETDYPDINFVLSTDFTRFPNVKAEGRVFDVQIPWEATDLIGQSKVVELSAEDSPFVLRTTVQFAETTGAWAFVSGPGSNLTAAKADFSSLITSENPALAGSLIHFWLSGLGPLDRPVATGEKGPADPPAKPIQTVACYIVGKDRDPDLRALRVPTEIYAPNLIGVYQIDVEIPSDWPTGTAYVFCKGVSPFASGGYLPIVSKR